MLPRGLSRAFTQFYDLRKSPGSKP